MPKGLEEEINWAIPMGRGKSFKSQLLIISFVGDTYHTWGERNCRTFKGTGQILQSLQSEVEVGIRLCMVSWRNFPNTMDNQQLQHILGGLSSLVPNTQKGFGYFFCYFEIVVSVMLSCCLFFS